MADYQPGSYGAAEAKEAKIWRYAAAFIYLLLFLILMVFNTYVSQAFHRAPLAANIFGIILILASLAVFWVMPSLQLKDGQSSWPVPVIALILLALGFGLACGFNFDLRGMENIPG